MFKKKNKGGKRGKGGDVGKHKFCPVCGEKIDKKDTYCVNCGYSFEKRHKKRKLKTKNVIIIIVIIILFYFLIRFLNGISPIPVSFSDIFNLG